jgi:hypothetical protein
LTKLAQPFFVRRTCTQKSYKPDEQGSQPLESYRNLPAYVLLGDPGAGKTEAFKREAEEFGGAYIKARDFATFEPKPEYQDKTLFIDALDEMRADGNDGRTPLDHIRKHLERIGRPRFRLSCREADWLGDSDRAALMRVSLTGEVIALHLDPLTDNDVIEILRYKNVPAPTKFVHKAGEHGLGELLRNPQTLNLLVEAVGGNEWPQSRKGIYEMACRKLVDEKNPEHRHAKREKHNPPDTLLDAAGYLCAIHLISGIAGFALDEDASVDQHYYWKELGAHDMPLLAALKTNLFQRDDEEQRIPVHRSVAEYLGARYLAELVENHGLPFGRILALITGEDGGMVPDLRGLAAWLSVHCISARTAMIERDPLGVVLYGDVRNFPIADKQLVLAALKNEAQYYPWFRSDDWSSPPFGALGTMDMVPAFLDILSSPSRKEADQALLDCVLDAVRHGEFMYALTDSLETVVRDTSYWPKIRNSAVQALMHVMQDNYSGLLRLAEDIREGTVEDREDEILGALLRKLYPCFISPVQILDYLHPPKNESLIGSYFMFWVHELPEVTANGDLPLLLDQLVLRHKDLRKMLREHQLNKMAGKLLICGLMAYGDTITDEHLYDWLSVGLDEYEHTRLDGEHAERIANWFTDRPSRYKAMIERGASLCADQENVWYCMSRCTMRLHGASPPADIGMWYLKKATTARQSKLAEYYFHQAVHKLIRDGGQQDLTLPALEFIESWVSVHPILRQWLEPLITCPIGEWQQEHALQDKKWKTERQERKGGLVSYFRQHIADIRNGDAHPKVLHDLALAYSGLLHEAQGETPSERLNDFLDGDKELIEAAHAGFLHAIDRSDLPSVSEIIDLELKGRMHYIRPVCLVGMDELYQSDPSSALQLDDAVLSRLLAFRLSYNVGNDPAWVEALIQTRPALAAEVLLAYALPMLRRGKEHVSGLYPLAYNDAYSEVARIALPALLEGFPLRVRKSHLGNALDPLLKRAINYLDKKALASIVAHKLELESMDAAQRVYWLACGLIIAPTSYTVKLLKYIGNSKVRRRHLASFLHDQWKGGFPYAALPETAIALLIELLAPDCSSERPTGAHWVSPAMHTADLVRSFINTLGGNPSEITSHELERLLALPELALWHNDLRHALHTQRIARRKATFRHLSVDEIRRTLANLQPASAADLAALTLDHLRDIAKNIRNDSTNDYRQYWGYAEGDKKKDEPKSESDCRDALLSDLKVRLGPQGIDAQRESNYADNKRADIKISFGGTNGFNIPIEIKQDRSPDLWRAIHEQLISKYVRDPGADGHGIYLVFWFGGKGMPLPIDGKKLRSAAELEDRLRQTLTPEESHRIQICVIDCALP